MSMSFIRFVNLYSVPNFIQIDRELVRQSAQFFFFSCILDPIFSSSLLFVIFSVSRSQTEVKYSLKVSPFQKPATNRLERRLSNSRLFFVLFCFVLFCFFAEAVKIMLENRKTRAGQSLLADPGRVCGL